LIEKTNSQSLKLSTDTILEAWAKERTQSVKDAAFLTEMNGTLCNNANPWIFTVISWMEWFVRFFYPLESYDPQADCEKKGFSKVDGGFFLAKHGGGKRLPQVYVDTLLKGTVLSDDMFLSAAAAMQILILVRGSSTPTCGLRQIKYLLEKYHIPRCVISPDATSFLGLSESRPEAIGTCERSTRKAAITPIKRLNKRQAKPGYNVDVFDARLGTQTQLVIVRPDFYVFATARDELELEVCLQGLREMLEKS
jgi:hypothetical protein